MAIAFSQLFTDALSGLLRGTVTVDEVLVLAENRKSEACYIAMNTLVEVASRRVPENRVKDLLQVVWRLEGASKCLEFHFIGIEPVNVVVEFVTDRLARHPEEVEYFDLVQMRHNWRRHPLMVECAQKLLDAQIVSIAAKRKNASTELGADVVRVKERVAEYSFTPDLNALLDKVEAELGSGDSFDQKALLTHLRTFFEKLHEQAGTRVRQDRPETVDGTDLSKCGLGIDFLQRTDVLTAKMRDLARALYGVLSNEGVHAIKSDREYVRLCRNMVAEYALVLFFELERRLPETADAKTPDEARRVAANGQ